MSIYDEDLTASHSDTGGVFGDEDMFSVGLTKYLDQDGDTNGYRMGGGILDGKQVVPGLGVDFLSAHLGLGRYLDGDGVPTMGAAADANVLMAEHKGDAWDNPSFRADVLTAGANATHNENTTGAGFGATLAGAKVGVGDKQNNAAIGFSEGCGLGFRVHHGDADGDGDREFGYGFDLGPISFDIKSELAGKAVNAIGDAANWLAGNDYDLGAIAQQQLAVQQNLALARQLSPEAPAGGEDSDSWYEE